MIGRRQNRAAGATGHADSTSLSRLGLALISFTIIIALAFLPVSHQWDEAITRWLVSVPSLFHLPASGLAMLGEAWLTIPVVAMISGLSFLRERCAAANSGWLVVSLITGSVIEVGLKAALGHFSPAGRVYQIHAPFGLSVAPASTFPSGHTLRAMLIARVALRRFPWLGTGLIVSVTEAVMYLGYHSFAEVLGGVCLGWALVEAGSVIRTRG